MSAESVVVTRLMALFEADVVLRRAVHGVYDRPTPRASPPLLEIGAVVASEWGTKDRAGCELRILVRHLGKERDDGGVAARIAAAVGALRGAADACDVVSARLIRTRSGYDRQGRWEQEFDLRVRCLGAVA